MAYRLSLRLALPLAFLLVWSGGALAQPKNFPQTQKTPGGPSSGPGAVHSNTPVHPQEGGSGGSEPLPVPPPHAQLAQYGYVIGTLEPQKSFLEKIDPADRGKFLHYHIFLTTAAGVEYEAVIDVNDVSPTKPLTYRSVSLNGQAALLMQDFGLVLQDTSDFHLISNTETSYGPLLTPDDAHRQAAGALDYIRHPGVLRAIEGTPWQSLLAQTTADPLQWALPPFDALFKTTSRRGPELGFTKVYVFGAPFTSGGTGMHVTHQNQGDMGTTFSATNAPWQDGGVIVERHLNFGLVPSVLRQLLMVRFSNQTDFSAESDDAAHPAAPGHTLNPTTQTFPFGLSCGDYKDFGPFSATQLEVATQNATGTPAGPNSSPSVDVYVKRGAFTSQSDTGDFTVVDHSTDSAPAGRAFGRAYSPLHAGPHVRDDYYVRLHAIDPGSWCDSDAGGTLRVSTY
jgi:hypothetical protein